MTLRLMEDWIEFDGVRVASLLPNITPTLSDRLNNTLERAALFFDESVDLFDLLDIILDILDEETELMTKKLGINHPRIKTLAERMAKAKMRVISTEEGTA